MIVTVTVDLVQHERDRIMIGLGTVLIKKSVIVLNLAVDCFLKFVRQFFKFWKLQTIGGDLGYSAGSYLKQVAKKEFSSKTLIL